MKKKNYLILNGLIQNKKNSKNIGSIKIRNMGQKNVPLRTLERLLKPVTRFV